MTSKAMPSAFENLALFSTPAKDIGIATLEPNNPKTQPRESHQKGVDFLLGHGVDTRLLADRMERHLGSEATGKSGGGEAVIDHRIGFEETLAAANREQSRATRPGAYQGDETSLGFGVAADLRSAVVRDTAAIEVIHRGRNPLGLLGGGGNPGFPILSVDRRGEEPVKERLLFGGGDAERVHPVAEAARRGDPLRPFCAESTFQESGEGDERQTAPLPPRRWRSGADLA